MSDCLFDLPVGTGNGTGGRSVGLVGLFVERLCLPMFKSAIPVVISICLHYFRRKCCSQCPYFPKFSYFQIVTNKKMADKKYFTINY